MKRFSQTLRLLRRNWKAFLGFEVLFKLAAATVFTPALFAIFSLTIRAAGLPYLSTDTVKAYLLHPVTIACLLLILLLTAFITLFDMQAVICCCQASHLDRTVTMPEMAMAGLANAGRVFHPGNWLLIVFVVLIIPFTNAAAVSGFISKVELPEFIADYVNGNTPLHALRIGLSVLLSLLAFRWCLSLHAFTLEKQSYIAACRESARLMKRHMLSVAVGTVGVGIMLELLLLLLGCIVVGLLFLVVRLLCPADLAPVAATYTLLGAVTLGSYLSMAFAVPAAFAYLSVRYYQYKAAEPQENAPAVREPFAGSEKRAKRICALLCAAILCGAAFQIYLAATGQDGADIVQQPEIAAHRGSSVTAPENSMPAFRQAIADEADWIELDVHQTKDGVVVVAHDESLKRIAGISKNVWELTYDELMQYDVGSWFSAEYAGLRLATLDEVLKLCKGNIKLNIELKPTGHEPDFARHVLDLLDANGYAEGEYILASLNAEVLQTIKQLAPARQTLYIMTLAVGNVKDIPFADAYSIEESSVTERLVSSVHAVGKQVFVWTVNRAENVEKFADLHVDCIISDDPVMARAALRAASLSDDLQAIVSWLFPAEELAADGAGA